MTDTRCANPGYQLEVDTMIVEYTVYHAIEAKLKLIKSQISDNPTEWEGIDPDGAAERLIQSSHIMIRLFRQNHADTQLSSGATFDIKILEFLVLLDDLLRGRDWPVSLQLEQQINTAHRRTWLQIWAADQRDPARDIKMLIDTDIVDDSDTRILPMVTRIEMIDLLDRFMELSAEISDALGCVNEHWYRLAGEFVALCAIERMGRIVAEKQLHGELSERHRRRLAAWVSECFAYGIVEPSPSKSMRKNGFLSAQDIGTEDRRRIDKIIREQKFIREMFRVKPSTSVVNGEQQNGNGEAKRSQDGDGDINLTDTPQLLSPATEDPAWTAIRTKHHMIILDILNPCTGAAPIPNSTLCPCERDYANLRQSYNLQAFYQQLRDYIEGIWCLNADNISEKPVLVQIEEGKLGGLDEHEFQAFLDRVGLKVGGDGGSGRRVVKWVR